MAINYLKQDVIQRFNDGEELEFLFFYGHYKKPQIGSECLSQFYDSSFYVDEFEYQTAEHWMMYNKAALFDPADVAERILASKTPMEAKNLGRRVGNFDPEVWDEEKFEIVVTGNIAKFWQHKDLQEFLLSTGDKILVEASPSDKIWGVGMSSEHEGITDPNYWKGENLLGFALMEAREWIVDELEYPGG